MDLPPHALGQRVLPHPLRVRVGAHAAAPAAAHQWRPINGGGADMVPLAHSNGRREPRMLTSDLALRTDPAYDKISRRFAEDPEAFADAFARAWFKLTHRDMGPIARYLGPEVPSEELIWQDPVPAVDHELIDAADAAALKAQILDVGPDGLGARLDDVGGGILVPRQRQARRRQRRPHPPRAAEGLGGQQPRPARDACSRCSSSIQASFNAGRADGKQVSLADLIVLAGNAAVEKAAKDAGVEVEVVFHAGSHRRHAGADRRRVVRLPRAGRRRLPQLLRSARVPARRSTTSSTGRTCSR